MSWTTIYIKGKEDFRDHVRRKLEHSDLDFMPGSTGTSGQTTHEMYWINEKTTLRQFKEAIGGKIIWKHRLQFFTGLEEFLESENTEETAEFTSSEIAMMEEMRKAS